MIDVYWQMLATSAADNAKRSSGMCEPDIGEMILAQAKGFTDQPRPADEGGLEDRKNQLMALNSIVAALAHCNTAMARHPERRPTLLELARRYHQQVSCTTDPTEASRTLAQELERAAANLHGTG